MSERLRTALRLYGRLSLVFVVGYVALVTYDDFNLARNVASAAELATFLGLELLILLSYFVPFTLAYWLLALIVASSAFRG